MGRLWGRLDDPTGDAGYADPHPPRMGFFTDTSVCIGCKACEVACKTWNEVPDDGYLLTGMSYDNTQELGASTWRHVAFVEKAAPSVDLGMPGLVLRPARPTWGCRGWVLETTPPTPPTRTRGCGG